MRGLKLRRWTATGLAGAALMFTATGTLALAFAPTIAAETPAERCERETAQWNAAYETAWRAANPGTPGPPPPNPAPYVCVDPGEQTTTTPPSVPTLGAAPTGENNGSGLEVSGGTVGDVGSGTDLVPAGPVATAPPTGATTMHPRPVAPPRPVPDHPGIAQDVPRVEATEPPLPTAVWDAGAGNARPSNIQSPVTGAAAGSPVAIGTLDSDVPDRTAELLLIAAAAAGLSAIRRNPRLGLVSVKKPAVAALPGTPIPRYGDDPSSSSQFGTSRIIPGQGVQAGFSDPDMSSPLGQRWGKTIVVDPDATLGARGAYSGNLLTPKPGTNGASVGVPGLDSGRTVPRGGTTSKASALEIDAVKGAQLQIVSATPVGLTTVNYGGLPALVVHYQYQYQVQYVYSLGGNAFVHSTDWTDVSLDEVGELYKMGAYVPKIN